MVWRGGTSGGGGGGGRLVGRVGLGLLFSCGLRRRLCSRLWSGGLCLRLGI